MSFKKVVGLALGTLFLLAGCTNPNMLYIETRPDIHPDPSKATLVIYRTLSYCGPTRVHNFIDKTYIGTTQGKCFFVAKVDPGSHYVIAVAENKACAKANFELGKVYYLQQGMFRVLFARALCSPDRIRRTLGNRLRILVSSIPQSIPMKRLQRLTMAITGRSLPILRMKRKKTLHSIKTPIRYRDINCAMNVF